MYVNSQVEELTQVDPIHVRRVIPLFTTSDGLEESAFDKRHQLRIS